MKTYILVFGQLLLTLAIMSEMCLPRYIYLSTITNEVINSILGATMKSKSFSMLELLAVIFVLALLFALLLPSIKSVKLMATTALCQKNLKDIHALMMSYAVDHDNTLPGRNVSDYSGAPGNLYAYWNGHLVPYIDPNIEMKDWTRWYRIEFDNKWHTTSGGNIEGTEANLALIQDAAKGEGLFKMFVCPEVINNVRDPGLYYEAGKQGIDFDFPKIYNATSFNRWFGGVSGLLTTYAANDELVSGPLYSTTYTRIDQFNNFGKKALLIEGGSSTAYTTPYITVAARLHEAGHLDMSQVGFHMWDASQFSYTAQSLTFAHDTEEEFWYSNSASTYKVYHSELATMYNEMDHYESYVAVNVIDANHKLSLVTHTNPYSNSSVLTKFKSVFGFDWTWTFNYVQDEILYKAATGKSNILYGDGSVAKEHAAWIFNNRRELFKGL